MKLVKSLLLGSAAGLVAVAGAQAADLPIRAAAPAVNYVQICDVHGAGYFYIPGSQTCLRIFGYVRADYLFGQPQLRVPVATPAGAIFTSRTGDNFTFFARAHLGFDARTATEWGLLRSVIRYEIQNAGGIQGGTAARVPYAFIQFGGLTAGRLPSFFDFWTGQLYPGGIGSDTYNAMNVLAYTATFGNGFSATISLEDPGVRRTAPAGITNFVYGGRRLPDLVGNVRVDQAWGSAQVMGAVHEVRSVGFAVNPVTGAVIATEDDKYGFSVGAGVNFKLPFLAPNDALWLQAVYSDGATNYAGPASGAAFTTRRIGFGIADAFVDAGGAIRTTKSWSLAAAIQHYWTPQLRSNFQVAYGRVEVPGFVQALNVPAAPGGVVAQGAAIDFNYWQLGTNLIWAPVAGLQIGGEVVYTRLEGRGVQTVARAVAPGGAALIRARDHEWSGRLRIQRDF